MSADRDAFAAGSGGEETVVRGKPGGLGTFGGVFTPSLLTILGASLASAWVGRRQRRSGGNALIVTISTAITFLTALCVVVIFLWLERRSLRTTGNPTRRFRYVIDAY